MAYVRERVWDGTKLIGPGDFLDPFIYNVTMPQSLAVGDPVQNVGVIPGSTLTPFTDYGSVSNNAYTVTGTANPNAPRIIANKSFDRVIKKASTGFGNVYFYNCEFHLDQPGPSSDSALADCRTNTSDRWTFERCTFDPGATYASYYLNAVIGHHMTVLRCNARRVVDFVGSYNLNGTVAANLVYGNLMEWHAYWWNNETKGVVHPSDYETHNDGVQHQAGGPGEGYPYGVDVLGNRFRGYVFQADGTPVPTEAYSGDQWRHLAHQGVMIQQNQQKSTPVYPRIAYNWFEGYCQTIRVTTSKDKDGNFNGSDYDAVIHDNILLTDDTKLNGSSGGTDFYGVVGGNTYIVRPDNHVTLNGVSYPTDLVARTMAEGNNRFADLPNIHPLRRGKLWHVRRDSTPG